MRPQAPGPLSDPSSSKINIATSLSQSERHQDCRSKAMPRQCNSISCNEINFKILGVNDAEFPTPFTKPAENSFSVEKSLIRKMVIYTAIATGDDPIRPIISGPLLKMENNLLTRRHIIESVLNEKIISTTLSMPPKFSQNNIMENNNHYE